MGTPRKDIVMLLLVLPLLAGWAAAAPGTDLPGLTSPAVVAQADSPLEKAFSQSGFQYFTFSYWNILSLKDGRWNEWDRDHWAEWNNSGVMWAYDEDALHFGTDSAVTYSSRNGVWDYHYMPLANYGGDIVGFSRDEVYTVGRSTTNASWVYRFADVEGHEDWEVVGDLGTTGLSKMWGLAPDDLYFGGAGGSFVHWNGTSAEVLSSGVFGNILSMWGTAANDIYLVAANDGLLHWDGQSLTTVAPPGSIAAGNLRKVWGSGPDDVWVVGVGRSIAHFDGTQWDDMSIAGGGDTLNGIYGSGPDDVWTIGGFSAFHFDGTGWTDYSTSLPTTSEYGWWGLFGMYQKDGDRYWDRRFGNGETGGLGLSSITYSVEEFGGDIIAAGNFRKAGPDSINYIARLTGTGWEPLYTDSGPNSQVIDLIEYDGQLIACGMFNEIDGRRIHSVAAWNGTQWSELGDGLVVPDTLDAYQAIRMTIWDGKLVVVGQSEVTAVWDGSSWTPLPAFDGFLYDAADLNGDLFVGGLGMTTSEGLLLNFNGSGWTPVGSNALDGPVYGLLADGGSLIVSGEFSVVGLGYTILARWNPISSWSPFGSFAMLDSGGTDRGSFVVGLDRYGDDVIATGTFNRVDGRWIRGAALWNETDGWRGLGSGLDYWSFDIDEIDGALWFAGGFANAGNRESFGIARWQKTGLVLDGPPVTVDQPAAPGEDYALRVSLTGELGDKPIVVHYRSRDTDSFLTARMFPVPEKDGIFESIIPGDYIADLGFQYYITGGGEEDEIVFPAGDPADPGYAPAWTGVTMSNFEFTPPAANSYVMMGIPFVPNASQSSILQGAMGTYDKSKWRFGRWNPTTSKYVEFPGTPDFAPGIGYWLIQRDRTTLTVNGVSTNTFGGVNIQLRPGWNMISTPYAFPILWSDVALVAGVEDRLVARSGGTYVDVNVMNPWEGYWVLKNGFDDAVINIPPIEAPVKALENPIQDADEGLPPQVAWAINIAAVKGDRSDVKNIAAVADGAEDGVDVMDFHEPPAMPGDVSLSFLVEAEDRMHHLSTDMRAEFTDGQAWDAELRVEGGGRVVLGFEGVEQVPAGFEVALITATGRIDLRATDTATVTVGESGSATLRLAVGDVQYVAEQEQNLPRPFALRPNYPNPFNPRTKISFTLPYASRVAIDIYDIRGRKVRTLVDGDYTAGLHEVDWLGDDDGGRSASTGVYFSRMRADGFEQVRKMTLVR